MRRALWLGLGTLLGATLIYVPTSLGSTRPKEAPAAAAPAAPTPDAPAAGAAEIPSFNPTVSFAPLVRAVEPAVLRIEVVSRGDAHAEGQIPPEFRQFFGDKLEGAPREQRGEGSGFVISADGLVLTNNHVVEGATSIIADLQDGTKVPLKVLGTDPALDVALCQLPTDRTWTYVALGTSANAEVGDWVVAVGDGLGLGTTVTAGILSGKGRVLGHDAYDNFLQTDAAINQGNSGGPLFDVHGQVIGMNTAIIQGANTVGFAIPAEMIREIVDDLQSDGKVARGFIGVQLQPLDPDVASALGASQAGALVAGVTDGAPGAKAGLAEGDIIVSLDGQPVKDSQDLIFRVGSHKPGDKVDLDVWHEGKERQVALTLGERPSRDGEARAASPEAEESSSGKLGIALGEVPAQLADRLGGTDGVLVEQVSPDGPADGKLLPGDVILQVNKKVVSTPQEAKAAIAGSSDPVLFLVRRDGRQQFVAVNRK